MRLALIRESDQLTVINELRCILRAAYLEFNLAKCFENNILILCIQFNQSEDDFYNVIALIHSFLSNFSTNLKDLFSMFT